MTFQISAKPALYYCIKQVRLKKYTWQHKSRFLSNEPQNKPSTQRQNLDWQNQRIKIRTEIIIVNYTWEEAAFIKHFANASRKKGLNTIWPKGKRKRKEKHIITRILNQHQQKSVYTLYIKNLKWLESQKKSSNG